MYILPAIDLKDGKMVRLYKGDFNTVHQVAQDPLETARAFSRPVPAGSIWWTWTEPGEAPESTAGSWRRSPPAPVSGGAGGRHPVHGGLGGGVPGRGGAGRYWLRLR